MAHSPPTNDVSTRSPFAGCTIVIVGICAMIFLVGFVIWNLFKLDDEIGKFTTASAVATPAPDLIENAAAFNHFMAKVQLFKDAVGRDEDAELRLTADDINFAIASDKVKFKDLQKTFFVTSIEDGKLHIQISFPLRGQPMSGQMRYLNGTMVAVPALAGDEIVLSVEQITSPGTEVTAVPEGFIGQMSPYRLAQRYMDDEILGPWMKKLTAVSVVEHELILTYSTAKAAARAAPKDMSPFVKRALALFAVFLLFFLTVIFLLITASRRRKAAAGNHPDS